MTQNPLQSRRARPSSKRIAPGSSFYNHLVPILLVALSAVFLAVIGAIIVRMLGLI